MFYLNVLLKKTKKANERQGVEKMLLRLRVEEEAV